MSESSRTPSRDIAYILESCSGNDTRFEVECYDIGHLYTALHFLERGLIKPPLFIQSVFGIRGGIGPHPEDVMHMKRTADRLFGNDYQWSVLGAGRNQFAIAAQAIAFGGNIRVGSGPALARTGPPLPIERGAGRQGPPPRGRTRAQPSTPDEARAIFATKRRRQRRVLGKFAVDDDRSRSGRTRGPPWTYASRHGATAFPRARRWGTSAP